MDTSLITNTLNALDPATAGFLGTLGVEIVRTFFKKGASFLKEGDGEKILTTIFQKFKVAFPDNKVDEEILIKIFEEYFKDAEVISEFKKVFDGKSHDINYDKLENLFNKKCSEYPAAQNSFFNFFDGIKDIIENLETLALKNEKLREQINAATLETIKKELELRGIIENLALAKRKYLEQLTAYHNNLRFTGIPDLKEKKEIALPSVFVMQRVVEEIIPHEFKVTDIKGYAVKISDSSKIEEIEKAAEYVSSPEGMRDMERFSKPYRSEPIKFDKVFKGELGEKFIILGNPGSGKSTLLKYILLSYTSNSIKKRLEDIEPLFPIYVEIRRFENTFKKANPGYNILDYLYDNMREDYQVTLPKGFFEKYLETGKALLLFDGLDEVADEGKRDEVRKKIDMFINLFGGNNSAIVTSRVAGYNRTSFSTDKFRHFNIEDFNDEEISDFIDKWYKTREALVTEAVSKAASLKKALSDRPRIQELAKNPLLLTIIAIIHRYEADLPQDRLTLYDKATEALLFTWDNVREIIDKKFTLVDKRRFLEKLAIHLQKTESGENTGTVIDKDELYKILLEEFKIVFSCDARNARTLVDEFLEAIRTRAGLLVEIGQDKWGFVHKTFQEYFAAKFIANESNDKYEIQIVYNYMDEFIENPFWQETLLLAIRAIPNKQAIKVLEYIIKKDNDGINQYLYHNHYFVMKFIAEQGDWLNDKKLIEEKVIDFMNWSYSNKGLSPTYSEKTWLRFKEWMKIVTSNYSAAILSGYLVSIAEGKNQDGVLRRDCASVVGDLGNKVKELINRLLSIAEDKDEDGWLRRDCAWAVGNLGNKDKAVEILLSIAEDKNQDGELRHYCAEAAGNLGNKDKAIINRLLSIAEDKNQDSWLRRDCAWAAGTLGNKDKTVEILLSIAEDKNEDGWLRRDCASAVGNLGNKDKAVINRLLSIAEDKSQYGKLRANCALAVSSLGNKDKAAEILLSIAEDKNQDSWLRRDCAWAAETLGNKDKAVINRLLSLAEDNNEDGRLRRDCAWAAGNLGNKDKAVEILISIAEDKNEDGWLRRDCASALGSLGDKDKAVEILISIAEDKNQDGEPRRYCASTVGRLGNKDKEVINRLLTIVEDEDQNGLLRCDCASAVRNLGNNDKAVINRLLSIAEDKNQYGGLRRDCASAVGNLGNKKSAVTILTDLYLEQKDITSNEAKYIYESLWDLTAI